MTPAARLLSFLLLLTIMFTCAYAAGTRLGPVAPAHPQPVPGMHMGMGMGSARLRS